MVWPISTPLPPQVAADLTPRSAARGAHMMLQRFRQAALDLKAASAAGPTSRKLYANFCEEIATTIDNLNMCKAVVGLNAAAIAMYTESNPAFNQSFDAVAEITARIAEMDALGNWIVNTAPFPTNASGFALEWQFDARRRRQYGTFTVAQTVGFRTQIDNFIAGTS